MHYQVPLQVDPLELLVVEVVAGRVLGFQVKIRENTKYITNKKTSTTTMFQWNTYMSV